MARTRRRARQRRQRLFAVGLGLGLSAGMLGLGELLARSAGVQPAYQADLLGGWRMLPEQHQQRIFVQEGGSFLLSTNADGMRTTLPRARRPGVWRVALLGDPIPFGWGVDDGGTVADGLQQALPAAFGQPVEVLNAAQPGYSTVQSGRFFTEVVQHYRPDLVVLFLAMHDHNRVLVSDSEHLHGARGPLSALRVGLARRSRLYQWARQRLVPLSGEAFLLPEQHAGELRVPRVSDGERERVLREMQAVLDGWGGKLALGHMPFIGDLEQGTPTPRAGAAWAEAWTRENSVPLIDLRTCCGPGAGQLVLPHDPGHLTAEGGRAAGRHGAAQVAEVLAGMGERPPGG